MILDNLVDVSVITTNGTKVDFTEVDHVSVVNNESYGSVLNLGHSDEQGHRTVILRDFAAVEITS
jgi:hypothetical protein